MSHLKILIAPLDWGLGHATRCIPIIRELIRRGCFVELAGSGNSGKLLQQEFPSLTYHEIPGYGITYPKTGRSFILKMIFQIPTILSSVRREHKWIVENHTSHQWNLIISDNRYGCWHLGVRSVFITHQLQILSGFGTFVDGLMLKLHYRMIQKFTHCWVPDIIEKKGLAGILSHPPQLPKNVQYVGPLSRLDPNTKQNDVPQKIVVALSGPEPQRSLLELKLINILSRPEWKKEAFLFLRGLPNASPDPAQADNIQYIHHLNSKAFAETLSSAKIVICRSGYSSVMDLVRLQKKAVLIPTPGQTEQEYLADWLTKRELFMSCHQDDPKMGEIILMCMGSEQPKIQMDFNGFKKALDDLGIQ
jgi:UDP:flavonoid glycosyltransferase YjiC (YdhE family)